jgi:thiol:disulfide interchange protein
MLRRLLLLLPLAIPLFAAERYGPPYDPKADPFRDLAAARQTAAREGKRILVDVGGEWCGWCHRMEAFILANPEVRSLLETNYVLLKVHFSDENKNEKFLSAYPKIPGYPHLFVLDAQGKLLHSQDTGELEEGKGYHLGRFREFLRKWSPPAK